jgi:hypothetical protein
MTSGIWEFVVAWTLDRTSQGTNLPNSSNVDSKNAATFDQQTQTRLMETHLLSLATAEIEGRPLWHYLQGYDNKPEAPPKCEGYLDRGQIRVPVS